MKLYRIIIIYGNFLEIRDIFEEYMLEQFEKLGHFILTILSIINIIARTGK